MGTSAHSIHGGLPAVDEEDGRAPHRDTPRDVGVGTPLTCRADMSKGYGDRWATLATLITDPEARTIRILDGMPTEAETGEWRTLTV